MIKNKILNYPLKYINMGMTSTRKMKTSEQRAGVILLLRLGMLLLDRSREGGRLKKKMMVMTTTTRDEEEQEENMAAGNGKTMRRTRRKKMRTRIKSWQQRSLLQRSWLQASKQ